MMISEQLRRSANVGDEFLIGFNDITKQLNLYCEIREYKENDTYIDKLQYISSFHIGENLIDFITLSDKELSEIRSAAAAGFNYLNPDSIDKYDSIYIYIIFNQANYSSLCNEYRSRLEIISEEFRFALNFCCNPDAYPELSSLSNLQRYYLYCIQYPDNTHSNSWAVDPSSKLVIEPYGIYDSIKDLDIYKRDLSNPDNPDRHIPLISNSKIPENVVSWVQQTNVSKTYYYSCLNIEEYLLIEFRKMIDLNIKIKKCMNCGKYFVLKGDYSTDYCDRINPGEKFTCKKIAAIKARKEKLNNNPILKEYEKAYKRNYAKRTNRRWSYEQFLNWVDEASHMRDQAVVKYNKTEEIEVLNEFKKYLGNK